LRQSTLLAALTAALLSGFVAPAHAAGSAQTVETEAVITNGVDLQAIAQMRALCPWFGKKVGAVKYGKGPQGRPYAIQDYYAGSVMVFYTNVNVCLRTSIRDAYFRAGGPSVLGFPAGPEFKRPDGVSWMPFHVTRNANYGFTYIYRHQLYGAHLVTVSSWAAYGGLDGRLGYPKSDLVKVDPTKANSTLRQKFKGGSVYKSATGHEWVVFNK
jgi:uncharacterized protein with LGFP repeats